MVTLWQLMAQAGTAPARPKPRLPLYDTGLLWAFLALMGGLLLAALVIALVDRWRRRQRREGVAASDQLGSFRALYERGEISREEYDRIRGLLGKRLREGLDAPPGPPSPGPTSPPGTGG